MRLSMQSSTQSLASLCCQRIVRISTYLAEFDNGKITEKRRYGTHSMPVLCARGQARDARHAS